MDPMCAYHLYVHMYMHMYKFAYNACVCVCVNVSTPPVFSECVCAARERSFWIF